MVFSKDNAGQRGCAKVEAKKFAAIQTGRTLRAIQRKNEQKSQRNRAFGIHRVIDTPQQNSEDGQTPLTKLSKKSSKALQSTTKKYTKNEMDQLAKNRYEDMLEWKKKKEQLKKRKKKDAVFKAGKVVPDLPHYLCGSDEPSTSSTTTTPWKSTTKSSALKKPCTPFAGKKSSLVPNQVKKPLVFKKRLTPLQQQNARPVFGEKKTFGIQPSAKSSKALNKALKALGVAPLPITPSAPSSLQAQKTRSTYKATRFQAPTGVKSYDLISEKTSSEQSDSKDLSPSEKLKALCEALQSSLKKSSIPDEIVDQSEIKEIPFFSNDSLQIIHKSDTSTSNMNPQEVVHQKENIEPEKKCEPQIIVSVATSDETTVEEDCKSSGKKTLSDHNTSKSEKEEAELSFGSAEMKKMSSDADSSPLLTKRLTFNAGSTPARVTRKRASKSSASTQVSFCCDSNPVSRLRPRTSCPRSTRRSRSVHCDESSLNSMLTPVKRSAKKRKVSSVRRRSKSDSVSTELPSTLVSPVEGDASTLQEEFQNSKTFLAAFTPAPSSLSSSENSNSPFRTPSSVVSRKASAKRTRISNLIDLSPFITKTRGSSSDKARNRKAVFNDLETMFNDVPLDSPLPIPEQLISSSSLSSPQLRTDYNLANHSSQKKSSKVNDSLLCHLTPEINDSSIKENLTPRTEMDLLLQPSKNLNETPELAVWSPVSDLQESTEKCDKSIVARSPLGELPTILIGGRRKSKRSSVAFARSVPEEATSRVQFPVTPSASHVSEECSSFLSPLVNEDSSLGSSFVAKDSESVPRLSLLPGLAPSPQSIPSNVNVSGDLISWETPIKSDKKIRKRSSLRGSTDTPIRRSKRLIKMIDISEVS